MFDCPLQRMTTPNRTFKVALKWPLPTARVRRAEDAGWGGSTAIHARSGEEGLGLTLVSATSAPSKYTSKAWSPFIALPKMLTCAFICSTGTALPSLDEVNTVAKASGAGLGLGPGGAGPGGAGITMPDMLVLHGTMCAAEGFRWQGGRCKRE